MADRNQGRGAPDDDPCAMTQYSQAPVDVAQLEAQVAAQPDNVVLLDILAFAYYSSDRFHKAAETYEKLVALAHDDPAHHYYLGNACYRLGRLEDAQREWALAETVDETGKIAPKARERLRELARASREP